MKRRKFLALGASTLGTASFAGCLGGQQTRQQTQQQNQQKQEQQTLEKTITATEWKFDPEQFTVKKGRKTRLIFKNKGSVSHNLAIGNFPLEQRNLEEQDKNSQIMIKTETIIPGKKDSITVTFSKTGEFPYWCDVSGHREAGMKGKIIVE